MKKELKQFTSKIDDMSEKLDFEAKNIEYWIIFLKNAENADFRICIQIKKSKKE